MPMLFGRCSPPLANSALQAAGVKRGVFPLSTKKKKSFRSKVLYHAMMMMHYVNILPAPLCFRMRITDYTKRNWSLHSFCPAPDLRKRRNGSEAVQKREE